MLDRVVLLTVSLFIVYYDLNISYVSDMFNVVIVTK